MENYRNLTMPKGEINRIEEIKKSNDVYETHFKKESVKWDLKYNELISEYIGKELDSTIAKKIDESETKALLYRGEITLEISNYLNNLSKENVLLKETKHEMLIFNISGKHQYRLTSATQVKTLIDSSTAERKRACDIIENHISYLRDMAQNFSDYSWKVNRSIELLKLLNS